MSISIAERLLPFSHTPGTSCILPRSSLVMRIFPTRIEISDLSGPSIKPLKAIDLPLTGPAKDFTVQLDLERGAVKVWGHYREGYVRYTLFAAASLRVEKCPQDGLKIGKVILGPTDAVNLLSEEGISEESPRRNPTEERLSFGSHKAQDWDLVDRRCGMDELFPFWFRLGQLTPQFPKEEKGGTLELLDQCEQDVYAGKKLEILQSFENLYRAGFEGILVPRLDDPLHQGFGITAPSKGFKGSALPLLSQGAALIRSLFFQEVEGQVSILPVLAPEFHCGRLINVKSKKGIFNLEWSKKTIRRLVFRATVSGEIRFLFQKAVKSYRLRNAIKDKGARIEIGQSITVEPGKTYLFDNFQK